MEGARKLSHVVGIAMLSHQAILVEYRQEVRCYQAQ